jgi:hypothetical protein
VRSFLQIEDKRGKKQMVFIKYPKVQVTESHVLGSVVRGPLEHDMQSHLAEIMFY